MAWASGYFIAPVLSLHNAMRELISGSSGCKVPEVTELQSVQKKLTHGSLSVVENAIYDA